MYSNLSIPPRSTGRKKLADSDELRLNMRRSRDDDELSSDDELLQGFNSTTKGKSRSPYDDRRGSPLSVQNKRNSSKNARSSYLDKGDEDDSLGGGVLNMTMKQPLNRNFLKSSGRKSPTGDFSKTKDLGRWQPPSFSDRNKEKDRERASPKFDDNFDRDKRRRTPTALDSLAESPVPTPRNRYSPKPLEREDNKNRKSPFDDRTRWSPKNEFESDRKTLLRKSPLDDRIDDRRSNGRRSITPKDEVDSRKPLPANRFDRGRKSPFGAENDKDFDNRNRRTPKDEFERDRPKPSYRSDRDRKSPYDKKSLAQDSEDDDLDWENYRKKRPDDKRSYDRDDRRTPKDHFEKPKVPSRMDKNRKSPHGLDRDNDYYDKKNQWNGRDDDDNYYDHGGRNKRDLDSNGRGRKTHEDYRRKHSFGYDSDEDKDFKGDRRSGDGTRDYRDRKTPDFSRRKSPVDERDRKTPDFSRRKSPVDERDRNKSDFSRRSPYDKNDRKTPDFSRRKSPVDRNDRYQDERRRSITPKNTETSKYGRRTPKNDRDDDKDETRFPNERRKSSVFDFMDDDKKSPKPTRRKSIETTEKKFQPRVPKRNKEKDNFGDTDKETRDKPRPAQRNPQADDSSICQDLEHSPVPIRRKSLEQPAPTRTAHTAKSKMNSTAIDSVADAQFQFQPIDADGDKTQENVEDDENEKKKKVRKHKPIPRYGKISGSKTLPLNTNTVDLSSTSSIRDAVFNEWKKTRGKEYPLKLAQEKKEREEKELKEMEELKSKREMGEKAYQQWLLNKKRSAPVVKKRKEKSDEEKRRDEMEAKEMKRKQMEKVFEEWKKEKLYREREAKRVEEDKRRDEERKQRKKSEEKEEKKEKFDVDRWKEKKKREIERKKYEEERKQREKEEEEYRLNKEKIEKSNEEYEAWRKRKETETRRKSASRIQFSEDRAPFRPASSTIPFGR
ncbi:DgyrCDS6784 [Dimorphilus gyrociliatus]|uniref:DgyrCDS6784 n=1 Tax=Dimorphilus gyrociliatus TaxID=2664684 RepID=A0A7I8VRR0_9ANNE|nr:DgyrCDS6784 [Dimorphilus gyrociliatus]